MHVLGDRGYVRCLYNVVCVICWVALSACKGASSSAESTVNAASTAPPTDNIDVPQALPSFDKLEQTHVRAEVESHDDASQSFDTVVPKHWKQQNTPGNVKQALFPARILATFAPGDGPVVTVTVTAIPASIPLDVWARLTFVEERYTIVASRWVPGPYGLFFDITGQRRESGNGLDIVRRATLHLDGPRIFMVNTIAPRAVWDTYKQDFWRAHVGFELSHPKGTTAEPVREVYSKSPAFRLQYPGSWSAEAPEPLNKDLSGMHLRLLAADGKDLDAYMVVRASRAAERPLNDEVLAARRMLEKSSVKLTGEAQPIAAIEDPRAEFVKGYRGGFTLPAQLAGNDIEVRLSLIRRDGIDFTFALCSPRVTTHPLPALRALRAFEIARDTLELPEKQQP
ncbi:MAG: hypothetical protein ABW321_20325 [Polyangiales bacterium]